MSIRLILIFLTLIFIPFTFLNGQEDSDIVVLKSDSINENILQTTNEELLKLEEQRKEDSIKRTILESELSSLKTTDNLKKEELLSQIQALKEQDSIRLSLKKSSIDSLRASSVGFPVIGFFKDTLFSIYSKQGSFSPKERAEAVSERIHNAGDNFHEQTDSIIILEVENNIDLVLANSTIISISENDALWNNTSKLELANKYKEVLTSNFVRYKTETSFLYLSKKIGLALLVLFLLWLILRYNTKLFRWTAKKIYDQKGKLIKGIKIRDYTLFDEIRQIKLLLGVNKVTKWLFVIILVYVALPILFGIFPWTKNLADTLFGYILTPLEKIALGLWHYLPNIFTIAVIFIIFRYLIKLLKYLKSEIEHESLKIPGFYPDFANSTFQILRVLLLAFMFVLMFPYLPGSDSPVFKGVSVFLGFLFTFGSAGSLSNIVSGFVLTYMRLFKIGDRIKIGDVVGDVIEKTALVTRVRTIKNEIISVPNSTILNSQTTNFSSDAHENGLILHTTVTIGYDVPWKKVHEALIEAAIRTELVIKDPPPYVLQTALQDYYVAYQINAYTKDPNKQAYIYSDLHMHIQDVFNENGIEILSPAYHALRDGNKMALPDDYIDAKYQSPSFNVKIKKDGAE